MPVVRTNGRTWGHVTTSHYQNFSYAMLTKFSYSWCSAASESSALLHNGCYKKASGKPGWNITFLVVLAEHLKRFSCFSRRNIPSGNSCSISTKPSVSFSRGRFFDKWNWFVQMVNKIPGQNLLVLNFAYHFPKLWSDRFSHLNCKQPLLSLVSGSLFQMRKNNYDTDLPKTCIVDTGSIRMQQ